MGSFTDKTRRFCDDDEIPGIVAYIDLAAIDADAIRSMAGAHPACVGYPDGVPETWRTPARVLWAEPESVDPAALFGPLRPDWSRHDAPDAGGAGGGAIHAWAGLDDDALADQADDRDFEDIWEDDC